MFNIEINIVSYNSIDIKTLRKLLKRCKVLIKSYDIVNHQPDFSCLMITHDTLGIRKRDGNKDFQINIVSNPITDNYFAYWYSNSSEILISTYQVQEILKDSGVILEQYIVAAILKGLICKQYIVNGINPIEVFSEKTEGYIFDFCADKKQIVHGLSKWQINGTTRSRITKALGKEMCDLLEKSFSKMKPKPYDFLSKKVSNNWLDWLIAFGIGIAVTFVMTP